MEDSFNLFQMFRMFDVQEEGFVQIDQFTPMFICLIQKELNQALAEQVFLVFSRYDTDEDGKLSYTEFCQIFLP